MFFISPNPSIVKCASYTLLDPRFKKLAFRFDASSRQTHKSAKDALKTELQIILTMFNCQEQPIEITESLAISTSNTDKEDSIWKDFYTSDVSINFKLCSQQ